MGDYRQAVKVMRLLLKGLGIAFLMGVFWAAGWGAVTGCLECGVVAGLIMVVISFVILSYGYLWLTRHSAGRLRVATGKIRFLPRRMLVLAPGLGLLYGAAAYLANHSIPLALVAAVAIGVGELVLVPLVIWRLLKPELIL